MTTLTQEPRSKLVCVVTGGSQGIGRAIVEALLREDERTIVYSLDRREPIITTTTTTTTTTSDHDSHDCNDRNKDDGNNKTLPVVTTMAVGVLQAQGRPNTSRWVHVTTNVADTKAFLTRLQTIFAAEQQQLDCLVNNAGIFETSENHNILWDDDTTWEQINELLQTNYCSVVHGTREAVKLMKQQQHDDDEVKCRKVIINIASTGALNPFPGHPVYSSSKAAVLQFTQTAQLDLEPWGFAIYAVCPGITDTEMGHMGGTENQRAVAALRGGKRTSPVLVAQAVLDLVFAKEHGSYAIVDNHEIQYMDMQNTRLS